MSSLTRADDPFAGFPQINVLHPGDRSFDVITSDAAQPGLLRPQWTRAMSDVGAWPVMFRFQNNIYLEFNSVNGHLGTNNAAQTGATGELIRYKSSDNGQTWTPLPSWAAGNPEGEYVVAGNTLYRYNWNATAQATEVRTSTDGVNFTAPQAAYAAPFWMWGTTYDASTGTFWAAPHAITTDAQRQVDLIKSTDGIHWSYVSQVHGTGHNESETAIQKMDDGTMVALVREKYNDDGSWMATSTAPYTTWTTTYNQVAMEGEHFFTIGGETFVTSRAYLDPNLASPQLKADAAALGDPNLAYAMIYRFTDDHQLIPWAVLDSMGDDAYPFLIETPTQVLVAYYSQHQDQVDKTYMASFDKATFLGLTVPEPTSVLLLAFGGVAMLAARRWRKNRDTRA